MRTSLLGSVLVSLSELNGVNEVEEVKILSLFSITCMYACLFLREDTKWPIPKKDEIEEVMRFRSKKRSVETQFQGSVLRRDPVPLRLVKYIYLYI